MSAEPTSTPIITSPQHYIFNVSYLVEVPGQKQRQNRVDLILAQTLVEAVGKFRKAQPDVEVTQVQRTSAVTV